MAFASALAWTATAADPAGSSSQTSPAPSTFPSKPPVAADSPSGSSPGEFTPTPLIGEPDDWWTVDAGYVINPHTTVAVGYGHFGTVANHDANSVSGVTTEREF